MDKSPQLKCVKKLNELNKCTIVNNEFDKCLKLDLGNSNKNIKIKIKNTKNKSSNSLYGW